MTIRIEVSVNADTNYYCDMEQEEYDSLVAAGTLTETLGQFVNFEAVTHGWELRDWDWKQIKQGEAG